MCCIACARNYQQVLPFPPRRGHQFVGRRWVVERHHQGTCALKVQTPYPPGDAGTGKAWLL